MRYFLTLFVLAMIALVSVLGLRDGISEKPPLRIFPDMDEQMRYKPQAATDFFADGRQDRPSVPGAIPTAPEHLKDYLVYDTFTPDTYLVTGKLPSGDYGKGFLFPVDRAFLELGREKFNIFCVNCHGLTGDGNGVTKQYGMSATPSYHTDRIRQQPEGMIFETITQGRNLMGPYGNKLRVRERWAVVAYVRALQRARQGSIDEVPPGVEMNEVREVNP